MNVIGPINVPATVGGAGVSTNNADSAVMVDGWLLGIYVKYGTAVTPPATCDMVITTKGGNGNAPAQSIVTLTNVHTDRWVYPRVLTQDPAGADVAGSYDWIPIADFINCKLQQCDDGCTAQVWILVD